jgi:hypothetical protein
LSWSEGQAAPFRSAQVDQERVPGPGRYSSITKILPDAKVTLRHGDPGMISHFHDVFKSGETGRLCTATAHSRRFDETTSLAPVVVWMDAPCT